MSFLKKCDVVLEKAIAIFCVILFAGIVLDILAGVFWRYVLNNPLTWYEEVARFLSIWMILVGSSMTIRIDGHTSIDFVQMLIKNPKGRTIAYVITRVIAAASMILMFPISVEMMRKMGIVIAGSTRVPMWVVYLAFPVGIVCMLIAWAWSIPKFAKEVHDEAVVHQQERALEKLERERKEEEVEAE